MNAKLQIVESKGDTFPKQTFISRAVLVAYPKGAQIRGRCVYTQWSYSLKQTLAPGKAGLQKPLNQIILLMSFLQGASFDEFMSVTRPGKNSCPDNKTSF